MIKGKPQATFALYLMLLRVFNDMWHDAPLSLQWALIGYGVWLVYNYWFRVRPARIAEKTCLASTSVHA
jgi:hypothetical protein